MSELRPYSSVKRYIKTKYGKKNEIILRRFKCKSCGKVHRELTDQVIPYKHYERDVIEGVIEGLITPEVLGFEDYPCEATMKRWKSLKSNILL